MDDAATHLRLFKQARAKMKFKDKIKTPKDSPLKDLKGSPRKVTHKRNKSETDISWYNNKLGDGKKGTLVKFKSNRLKN